MARVIHFEIHASNPESLIAFYQSLDSAAAGRHMRALRIRRRCARMSVNSFLPSRSRHEFLHLPRSQQRMALVPPGGKRQENRRLRRGLSQRTGLHRRHFPGDGHQFADAGQVHLRGTVGAVRIIRPRHLHPTGFVGSDFDAANSRLSLRLRQFAAGIGARGNRPCPRVEGTIGSQTHCCQR